VDVEITPEPTEEERQAILEALSAEEEGAKPPSPWHRAALDPEANELLIGASADPEARKAGGYGRREPP